MIKSVLTILLALQQLHQTFAQTTFHFTRLEYRMDHDPSYLKGWYTDYPEMDDHTVALINRLTQVKAAKMRVKPSHVALHMFPCHCCYLKFSVDSR